jgi:hypothetical protein
VGSAGFVLKHQIYNNLVRRCFDNGKKRGERETRRGGRRGDKETRRGGRRGDKETRRGGRRGERRMILDPEDGQSNVNSPF